MLVVILIDHNYNDNDDEYSLDMRRMMMILDDDDDDDEAGHIFPCLIKISGFWVWTRRRRFLSPQLMPRALAWKKWPAERKALGK